MKSYFKRHFTPEDWQYLEPQTGSVWQSLQVGELEWDEQEHIWDQVDKGGLVLSQVTYGPISGIYISEEIEYAIQAWDRPELQIGKLLRLEVLDYLGALAAAWGSFVGKELGMEWMRLKDEYKLTMGLWHREAQLPIFPFYTVARAWKEKEYTLPSQTVQAARKLIFDS